tara:strand:+ start:36248 stop:38377 length:2130 start_codon:yes stop_codon:yes gene_type:complete
MTPIDLNQNSFAYNREYILSEDKNNQILSHQNNRSDQSDSFQGRFDLSHFTNNKANNAIRQSLIADSLINSTIAEQWESCQLEYFCIAEIGFDAGINFLLTCLKFEEFLNNSNNKVLKRCYFTVFESAPICKKDIEHLLNKYLLNNYSTCNASSKIRLLLTSLLAQYPLLVSGCHRLHFNNITLDLWFGDVHQSLANIYKYQNGLFDCWLINKASYKQATILPTSLIKLLSPASKHGAMLFSNMNNESSIEDLQRTGFCVQKSSSHKNKPHKNIQPVLIAQFNKAEKQSIYAKRYGQHYRPSKETQSKDIAIIGGGISSACLSLALIKRGYKVTLYCKDNKLGTGASGNHQGALYPLLNKQHDALSELFTNSFLYARQYVEHINQSHPFDHDLSGLLQLYYDQSASIKLDKILEAKLPLSLVKKVTPSQTDQLANLDIGQFALYYSLGGWLSPVQMVQAIFNKAQQSGQLEIKLNYHLKHFEETKSGWTCHFEQQTNTHELLVLTTAMNTLDFKQCEALPLSAARGQVSHIESNEALKELKMTLCHEGYLTPLNNGFHCMGATFKRHDMNEAFSQQEQTDNKNKLSKCIKNKQWIDVIDDQQSHANIGIRCTTRDHFPYMGALPNYQATKILYQHADKHFPCDNAPFYKNVFILTGLGSRGLNTAPLLAETLASQINHEPLPLNMPMLNALQGNRQWVNYLKKGKKLKI